MVADGVGSGHSLRHETLDLTRTLDDELVLFDQRLPLALIHLLGQLIHTQDSDDVLERLVLLEDLLGLGGDVWSCQRVTKWKVPQGLRAQHVLRVSRD